MKEAKERARETDRKRVRREREKKGKNIKAGDDQQFVRTIRF
jgi:hypothetical protein